MSHLSTQLATRGLAVDTDKGLLLKLSYIHAIALRTVFRGRRRLTKEEVLAEYGGSGACARPRRYLQTPSLF